MAAVTIHNDFGTQENKIYTAFTFSPSIFHEVMGPDAMILVFRMFNFKPAFLLSLPSSKRSLVPLHFLHWSGIIWVSEAVDISPGNLDSSL